MKANIEAKKSETGVAAHTPLSPSSRGRIRILGIKKII